MVLVFVSCIAFVWFYIPWVLSEPIEAIQGYKLDNLPPPDYARSFTVNDGSAIFFRDDVPSKHPLKFSIILSVFFAFWLVLVWLYLRLKRLKREA